MYIYIFINLFSVRVLTSKLNFTTITTNVDPPPKKNQQKNTFP